MDQKLKNKLKKALEKMVDSSIKSIQRRKELTEGKDVDFKYMNPNLKLELKIEQVYDFVQIPIGNNEFIKTEFVPYTDIDSQIEQKISEAKQKGLNELIIDKELSEAYFSRFN